MIILLVSSLTAINFMTAYILLDEIQYRSHTISRKRFFFLLPIAAIVFGILSFFHYPILKTIVMILWNLSLGKCLFHHHRTQLIYDGFFALCIGICELLILPIIQVISVFFQVNQRNALWYVIYSMLMVQLIVFYMYHLYRKMYYKESDENLGFAILSFLLLPIFSFINILIVATISQFYMYPWLIAACFIDILFIVFLNIYLAYIYHAMIQSQKLKQELALYEQKNQLQYAYYQKLEESYQQSRQMIHDVKRHLQMLDKTNEKGYKQDFQTYLNQYAMPYYSNHKFLNMILNEKAMEAQKEHIDFTCETAHLSLDFMKEFDITTIFLNLLDNAIDACKECEEGRYIKLKADTIQDFLVIEIINSIATRPHDDLISSKRSHEGLGLKNVAQALETYGGNMQVEFNEHEFYTHLYIPME